MQFFNKYRELFEVQQAIGVPRNRLQLDNELFIEKPYINTYAQEFSLQSKLNSFKKDYNDFALRLNQESKNISVSAKLTPKLNSSLPVQSPPPPHKKGERRMKESSWLRDEQQNILKHSQLQHIFNQQLTKPLPQIEDSVLGRVDLSDSVLSGAQHKDRKILRQKRRAEGNSQRRGQGKDGAAKRESAKQGLAERRERLRKLLQLPW